MELNGDIIGAISLHDIADRQERLEIGYSAGSRWWNRGLMTEAAAAVIRYAFTELNAHKIVGIYDTENVGSGRVMIKNGMRQEGVLREHSVRKDGSRCDKAVYAVLKHEWAAQNG